MVKFVLTPPLLIPVAIAAVLGAAMMKTPEKAPDSYHLTVDIPKATYDTVSNVLCRKHFEPSPYFHAG